MSRPRTWDIFCKVVDNYGDAAVCWRLGRQLAEEHGATVRLWISDLVPLHALCPSVSATAANQTVDAVSVRTWSSRWESIEPAEIVIEAFGCGVPDEYVRQMATRTPSPLWIVLEYLSAERWVPEHHGLPSPHPRWPIPRYFFFPGFTDDTGGVLRERSLLTRRQAFGVSGRHAFWSTLAFEPPADDATVVSLFAYEGVPVGRLLSAWASRERRIVACVPLGQLVSRIALHLGRDSSMQAGDVLRQGNLEVRILPFLVQNRYDELLWSCDCNFVRGEDSFVRAQWAARPFVWNVYPQLDNAHAAKLEAFLDVFCTALPDDEAQSVRGMWRAWNGARGTAVESAWDAFWQRRGALTDHARSWAEQFARKPDLASNLAKFCAERLQ